MPSGRKSISSRINRRVLSTIAIGTCILSIALGVKQYLDSMAFLEAKSDASLHLSTKSLAEPIWNFSQEVIIDFSQSIVLDPDVHSIEIVSAEGDLVYRSNNLATGNPLETLCRSSEYFCKSREIYRDQEFIALITVAFDLSHMRKRVIETTLFALIMGLLATLVVALVTSRYLSNIIKTPLETLSHGAKRLSEGDLNHNFIVESQDELGSLAESFMLMRDSIRTKIMDLVAINDISLRIARLSHEADVHSLLLNSFKQKLRAEHIIFIESNDRGMITVPNLVSFWQSQKQDILTHGQKAIARASIDVAPYMEGQNIFVPLVNFDKTCFGLIVAHLDHQKAVTSIDQNYLETLAGAAVSRLENLRILRLIEYEVIKKTEQLTANQRELVEASRKAGMAEVAIGFLHNIGNIMTSLFVSCSEALDQAHRDFYPNRAKNFVALVREKVPELEVYLQAEGREVLNFWNLLNSEEEHNKEERITNLERIRRGLQNVDEIVKLQLNYAKIPDLEEVMTLQSIIDKVLDLCYLEIQKNKVKIHVDIADKTTLTSVQSKVSQILVNLLLNAIQAFPPDAQSRQVWIQALASETETEISFSIRDNGCGISPENQVKIFNFGFTTKNTGNGLGLHSSSLMAYELGGVLVVESPGVGKGATFSLTLPKTPGQINDQSA
ncbi:sensor histidine kinase [Pseudobacteriovorax antillogorgiicola]|uniref:histidine kinase n=1 Tax=Pseudobacteriovorax antillogorgiicola TaxID=1513793 RepID=A0A1Y6BI47_9BACT|nr:sensor histidine kinase [Pseudobacteriovorax antillogorgiicola]TCS56486.1 HAMP domain-containing protein [Pseudobacteriovorax antillogorgiicola]SMF04888.1 HAMP domain-containing protein [Pseudobacteriovorax antillogorgiicola]